MNERYFIERERETTFESPAAFATGPVPLMQRGRTAMKATGLLFTFLAACASQSPDPAEIEARKYERENARVVAIEKYIEKKRNCAAQGGIMQMPRTTGGRLPPTASELRLATCASPNTVAIW